MKQLLLSILAGMMTLGAVAQDGKFSLTGEVKGLGSLGYYALTDVWGEAISDGMAQIPGGKVDFSFDMDSVGTLMVFSNNRLIILPAIVGEAVTIGGEMDNYTVDGSALYRDYNEVLTATWPQVRACRQYDFKQACQDEIKGLSAEAMLDLYKSKLRENVLPISDVVLDFVAKHPDSESSMLVLHFLDYAEDIEKAAAMMSERVLNGRMRPYYESNLDRVLSRGASDPLLGKLAPELELPDLDGKLLSLSSMRGKWVLINFWDAECGNATTKFPALKQMYAQYKDKVEFLGLDCADDEAGWKAAVKKYGLPWINVLDISDFEDPNNSKGLYNVNFTPQYILIAPSGKVAYRSGSPEDMMYIFTLLFE